MLTVPVADTPREFLAVKSKLAWHPPEFAQGVGNVAVKPPVSSSVTLLSPCNVGATVVSTVTGRLFESIAPVRLPGVLIVSVTSVFDLNVQLDVGLQTERESPCATVDADRVTSASGPLPFAW